MLINETWYRIILIFTVHPVNLHNYGLPGYSLDINDLTQTLKTDAFWEAMIGRLRVTRLPI